MRMPTILTCDCGERFDGDCSDNRCKKCAHYYCEKCIDKGVCVDCRDKNLPDIAFSFGSRGKIRDQELVILGVNWRHKEKMLGTVYYTGDSKGISRGNCEVEDIELTGITPTCLAEMARKKGERVVLGNFDGWIVQIHKLPRKFNFPNESFTQEKNESLEEFCLRAAIKRNYLILPK